MKIVTMIARLLIGFVFFVLGSNPFIHFIPTPPIPGPAGEFLGLMFATHYIVLVGGVQVLAGLMLLTNQYVHLALVLLGAMLANILTYHITMQPAGLPLPVIVTILWVIVALDHRELFGVIFARTEQEHFKAISGTP